MTARRAPQSLEQAISRAAASLGGVRNAAMACGLNEYRIAHATNPNKPDMLRLDDAIELTRLAYEAGGGTPILDYIEGQLEDIAAPEQSWHTHMANVARGGGDFVSHLSQALADGKISPAERRQLSADAEQLRAILNGVLCQLEAEPGKAGA